MKKILFNTLLLFVINICILSQSLQLITSCDTAVIRLSEKVQGYGPNGMISYGLNDVSDLDSTSLYSFHGIKNVPDSLSDLKKYKIILDDFQLRYQSYRNGMISKDNFLEFINNTFWNIEDTAYLTNQQIKNSISVVAGYDQSKIRVYVIDENNNNDFSDDTIQYLKSNLSRIEDVLRNSRYVDYEYYDGSTIVKDKILINISLGWSNNENPFFNVPEFRYGKIVYNDKNYLVCREGYNPERNIYVLPDKPYFCSIDRQFAIKPNQYFNLEQEFFTYESYYQTPEVIKIKKEYLTQEIYDAQIKLGSKLGPVSTQIGMVAPCVIGSNIMNDSLVSSCNLKGKYVFLDFWATFCAPCIAEFPELLNVYNLFDRSEFEIIGIVKDVTRGNIKEFLQGKQVIWPTVSQDHSLTQMEGYNIIAYPTTYLINPEGKIIATDLRGQDLFRKLDLLKVKKKAILKKTTL